MDLQYSQQVDSLPRRISFSRSVSYGYTLFLDFKNVLCTNDAWKIQFNRHQGTFVGCKLTLWFGFALSERCWASSTTYQCEHKHQDEQATAWNTLKTCHKYATWKWQGARFGPDAPSLVPVQTQDNALHTADTASRSQLSRWARWSLHTGAQEDRIQLQPQCRAHIDPPAHPAVALFNQTNIDPLWSLPTSTWFLESLSVLTPESRTKDDTCKAQSWKYRLFKPQADLLPLRTWYLSHPRSS